MTETEPKANTSAAYAASAKQNTSNQTKYCSDTVMKAIRVFCELTREFTQIYDE